MEKRMVRVGFAKKGCSHEFQVEGVSDPRNSFNMLCTTEEFAFLMQLCKKSLALAPTGGTVMSIQDMGLA